MAQLYSELTVASGDAVVDERGGIDSQHSHCTPAFFTVDVVLDGGAT